MLISEASATETGGLFSRTFHVAIFDCGKSRKTLAILSKMDYTDDYG